MLWKLLSALALGLAAASLPATFTAITSPLEFDCVMVIDDKEYHATSVIEIEKDNLLRRKMNGTMQLTFDTPFEEDWLNNWSSNQTKLFYLDEMSLPTLFDDFFVPPTVYSRTNSTLDGNSLGGPFGLMRCYGTMVFDPGLNKFAMLGDWHVIEKNDQGHADGDRVLLYSTNGGKEYLQKEFAQELLTSP